ncbi:GNAT family N-acetyltransferase [Virgibacillus halodenitrificans]|uniref:GNAT family N-acetyltransferase n=1 Tax=Virgibacillus halodenitrificans TaxID=1482 RepID=A0ABR7VLF3_VIRHA|nr:GNAT family N-acetyltransferase [Virgibacillus halodenitrificans]MBD1222095.1 GNAT family N-acetyltransferase [Virgibacillus halodenitrificans]
MSSISIRKINSSNESAVRKITLKEDQKNFIESVDECLEEANTVPQWRPVAIYNEEEMVGFAMYGSFGPNKDTWIDRIIIDEKYQGNGFGKKAMFRLIEIVSKEYGVKDIHLSIVEENKVARHLYESIGFKYINEKDPNGELIFKYTVKQ